MIEEAEKTREGVAASAPSRKTREQHEAENHVVYRSWCEVCVQSRGLGTQYRRRRKEQTEKDHDGPRIVSDLFFMGADEMSILKLTTFVFSVLEYILIFNV